MLPAIFEQGETHTEQPLRAKVIFNPASGSAAESPAQLTEILARLQVMGIIPEVYLVHPQSRVEQVTADALRRGIRLILVSGGDGTIDTVAGAMVGTGATLGVLPTGTRNNVARSLGIPLDDLGAAVEVLRGGQRVKVDMGQIQVAGENHWFLETATVGLASALFPAADDIQHGDITRIGDLLSTLITSQPAEMRLRLNRSQKILTTHAHVLLVMNMPYVGAAFRASPDITYDDNLLDVFVFSNLSKLDLVGYAVKAATTSTPEDERIEHFRVRALEVETQPAMPVLADGVTLGEGPVQVSLRRQALAMMAPRPVPNPAEQAVQASAHG